MRKNLESERLLQGFDMESFAMNGQESMLGNRGDVRLCAITAMFVEAIVGILRMQGEHFVIFCAFGENARSRDGGNGRIALDDGAKVADSEVCVAIKKILLRWQLLADLPQCAREAHA